MIFRLTTPDGQLPPPAVCDALQEMVRLAYAQVSKPVLPTGDEPHKEAEGAEQHPADYSADNNEGIHG